MVNRLQLTVIRYKKNGNESAIRLLFTTGL